ncbi:hypothetical protein NL108_008329 [Boleophthalmus pectinirostris]|nr:hypothetical protein NL108_008329 [Boleophthalmus pectinirostris]
MENLPFLLGVTHLSPERERKGHKTANNVSVVYYLQTCKSAALLMFVLCEEMSSGQCIVAPYVTLTLDHCMCYVSCITIIQITPHVQLGLCCIMVIFGQNK